MQSVNELTGVFDDYLQDGAHLKRVLTHFDDFLKTRWHAGLPPPKTHSLLPLVLPREQIEDDWGPRFVELVTTYRRYVTEALRANPAGMTKYLLGEKEIDPQLVALELNESGPRPLIGRPDVVLRPDGTCAIMELNLGSGAAGLFWYEQFMGFYNSELRLKPLLRGLGISFQSPLKSFAEALDRLGVETVAVLDIGIEYMFGQACAEYLNRYRRRGRALCAYYLELEPSWQGAGLEVDGCRVDAVYPNFLPNYFHEAAMQPLWTARRERAVIPLSTPIDLLLSSKAGLALVYQHEQVKKLTGTFSASVAEMIPPTAVVMQGTCHWEGREVDTVRLLRTAKSDLVLKAAASEMAKKVLVGRATDDAEWEKTIAEILASPGERWIVQKFAEHPVTTNWWFDGERAREFRGRYHLCPFLFDGLTGMGCRISLEESYAGPLVAPDFENCSLNIVGLR